MIITFFPITDILLHLKKIYSLRKFQIHSPTDVHATMYKMLFKSGPSEIWKHFATELGNLAHLHCNMYHEQHHAQPPSEPSVSALILTIVVTRLRLEGAKRLHFRQALPGTVWLRRLFLQRFLGKTGIEIHHFS